jgi:hypothetical protein
MLGFKIDLCRASIGSKSYPAIPDNYQRREFINII